MPDHTYIRETQSQVLLRWLALFTSGLSPAYLPYFYSTIIAGSSTRMRTSLQL
ncbi:hypothetical protein VCRA2110O179_450004 [Vibrio crassostreae]|nr:hypothetical protein VCRA2110O180_460006 [Vibrio crassostreae]CAK2125394.1 hypothetical protein VCRA2112O189_430006 [Vibrio crassostreae]CAK2126633.1 hypothetical protein VCRA2113O228_460004 [Vibrio crassostreae]CAK2130043.1 hypothetical protein VCRA2110O172_460004 [Vibrio crassostreae]CAK2354568.1 hypothetical protein VCRA2114O232_430008 [Vibrio crassostreae]